MGCLTALLVVAALLAGVPVAGAWMGADGTGTATSAANDAGTDAVLRASPRRSDGPLIVALDPGHGGRDPGAERGGTVEAELMLTFARELAEVLRRAGYAVALTRENDAFVSLRGRASAARAARGDVLISLHADAVDGGEASGATVYTLDAGPGDALTADLVVRQARGDRLIGVTVEDGGDEIARVLIDLARAETAPHAEALADALAAAMREAGLKLHKRPRLGAAFTVLKAPDIPSVLLELGFMSDAEDFANLADPAWRARMAAAIAGALAAWSRADAVAAHGRMR